MSSCPHCKRPFPPRLDVSGPIRRRLIEVLLSHPAGLAIDDLAGLVYSDHHDGGPLNARNSLWVIAYKANKELHEQGCRITSTKGRGAIYRMVKI